jgi:hypothetical protein
LRLLLVWLHHLRAVAGLAQRLERKLVCDWLVSSAFLRP